MARLKNKRIKSDKIEDAELLPLTPEDEAAGEVSAKKHKLTKEEEEQFAEYLEYCDMIKTTVLEKFNNSVTDMVNNHGLYLDGKGLPQVYVNMYRQWPHRIELSDEGTYLNDDNLPEDNINYSIDVIDGNTQAYIDTITGSVNKPNEHSYKFKNIDISKTFFNVVTSNPDAVVIRDNTYPIIIKDNAFMYWDFSSRDIVVLNETAELPDWIGDFVVEKSNSDDKRFFDFATYGSGGFDTISLEAAKYDVDVNTNYNDDLPHEEIVKFLSSDDSGLVILHGNPGTGKSAYIRNLIYLIKDKDFLVLDNSVFNSITDASFIQLLTDYENAIIILEDCESMLTDRVLGNNKMAALLNLSDGLLGDSFKFKFICTFNADIGAIDKALLRKGRMRIKYEFQNLTAEKTYKLGQKLGKAIPKGESLSLADIYNYGDVNDHTEHNETKLGFKSKRK